MGWRDESSTLVLVLVLTWITNSMNAIWPGITMPLRCPDSPRPPLISKWKEFLSGESGPHPSSGKIEKVGKTGDWTSYRPMNYQASSLIYNIASKSMRIKWSKVFMMKWKLEAEKEIGMNEQVGWWGGGSSSVHLWSKLDCFCCWPSYLISHI